MEQLVYTLNWNARYKGFIAVFLIGSVLFSLLCAFGLWVYGYGIYQTYCIFNNDVSTAPACNLDTINFFWSMIVLGLVLVAISFACLYYLEIRKSREFMPKPTGGDTKPSQANRDA